MSYSAASVHFRVILGNLRVNHAFYSDTVAAQHSKIIMKNFRAFCDTFSCCLGWSISLYSSQSIRVVTVGTSKSAKFVHVRTDKSPHLNRIKSIYLFIRTTSLLSTAYPCRNHVNAVRKIPYEQIMVVNETANRLGVLDVRVVNRNTLERVQ